MATTLKAPFGSLTVEDARGIIAGATQALALKVNAFPTNLLLGMIESPILEPHRVSQAFINGDHWQNSTAWIGPRPDISTTDNTAYTLTMQEIARQFVSQNAIGEVVDRHVNGVVGVIPDWGFTSRKPVPKGEELPEAVQKKVDQIVQWLTVWWDRNAVQEVLHDFCVTLLTAGRASLRLYVPRGKLTSREVKTTDGEVIGTVKEVRAASIEEALRLIWVEHPPVDKAAMICDEDTKEEMGVTLFSKSDPTKPWIQMTGNESAEFTYLVGQDDAPLTAIRMIRQNDTRSVVLKLDLGGRLTMREGKRPLFVTPQMWQQQKSLNLALSMIPRTIVTSGFLERTIVNAQMPGKWVQDASIEGGKRWVPDPYYTGPGSTNALVGVKMHDPATGAVTGVTDPQVIYREPVDPEPLMKAANGSYVAILQEAKQQHILAIQNTQASGKTHEQARADFKTSLGRTRAVVESTMIWLLETLVAMSEQFGGNGQYSSELRATCQCHLDVGPVTAEMRTALDGSVKAGTLSRETAIAEEGVVDTDAELQRLDTQPGAHLDIIERQSAVLVELTQAGAALEGAAEMAGIDPDLAKKLVAYGPPGKELAPNPNENDPTDVTSPNYDPTKDPSSPEYAG